MNKRFLKISIAAILLAGALLGQNFAYAPVSSAATTKPAAVVTNNLSKYGLKSEVSLPLTTTVNGLSYTVHKMMIYDINSTDAKNLMKLYGYANHTDYYQKAKYFIWTKITITNKSKYKMGFYPDDMNPKWSYFLDDGRSFDVIMPTKRAWTYNDKNALWAYILKPGETLATYQAYVLGGDLTDIRLSMEFKGSRKDIAFTTLK
ncbi:hypothetical protein [Paenibacillus sp. URB8-2]|uniref:hypothetical protein n=1 Tax=Paenibacillus sp. URB8-2 TaxID=2741301 RepID=UPI0015BB87A1|nr:hypothetical protein [Paenibacillus sp. URB8-2]BCG56757.1 hypothetical protein PUR_01820 [Paenibacillus sp. URB8-2]